MKRFSHATLGGLPLVLCLGWTGTAAAQSVIKHPGDHPNYGFEAEPHLALDPGDGTGVGPGFRGTFVLVNNGFISSINNSIGLGVGLDWLFFGDHCDHGCGDHSDVMVPVVMQWNFWLAPQWSVFGEPGVAFHFRGGQDNHHFQFDPFVVDVGGRFHFNDSVALTLRLGAPIFDNNAFTIGVSFLL